MSKRDEHEAGRQGATGAVRNSVKALWWGFKLLREIISYGWGLALDVWYLFLDILKDLVTG